MRSMYGNPAALAAEIGCQFRQGTDRTVRPIVYSVCKAIWPTSTDAAVAAIVGCSVRNGARYLSGELEVPAILLTAINVEITKRN